MAPGARYGRTTIGDLAARLRESAHEAPLVCSGRGGAAAVCLLRSRNDRPQRRRRHAGVSRRLRLVRRRWRVHDEAVPAGALLRRAGDAGGRRRRARRAPARSSASTASRSTRRCSRRGISFIASSGPASRQPHVDVLHPARRFWKEDDCSLVVLEQQILGASAHRTMCRGSRFPTRYFQFVRSGDAEAARGRARAQPARSGLARRADVAAARDRARRARLRRERARGAGARPRLRRVPARTSARSARTSARSRWRRRRAAAARRSSRPMRCARWRSPTGARGDSTRPRAAGARCSSSGCSSGVEREADRGAGDSPRASPARSRSRRGCLR